MLWHKPTEKPCAGHKLWIQNTDGSIDWIGSKTADVSNIIEPSYKENETSCG